MLEVSQLHAKKVAVVLRVGDQERVVCGTGSVEDHDVLGEVLRVDSSEDSHILLQGPLNQDSVTSGDAYGCDFCVALSQPKPVRSREAASATPGGVPPAGATGAAAPAPLDQVGLESDVNRPAKAKLPPRRLKHPPARRT